MFDGVEPDPRFPGCSLRTAASGRDRVSSGMTSTSFSVRSVSLITWFLYSLSLRAVDATTNLRREATCPIAGRPCRPTATKKKGTLLSGERAHECLLRVSRRKTAYPATITYES